MLQERLLLAGPLLLLPDECLQLRPVRLLPLYGERLLSTVGGLILPPRFRRACNDRTLESAVPKVTGVATPHETLDPTQEENLHLLSFAPGRASNVDSPDACLQIGRRSHRVPSTASPVVRHDRNASDRAFSDREGHRCLLPPFGEPVSPCSNCS